MISNANLITLATLLASTFALPTTTTPPTDTSKPIVVPGTLHYARNLNTSPNLQSRDAATKTFGDYSGQWSSHTDGSGTYVKTEDVWRYASGDKCWTDLFYVSSEMTTEAWVRSGSINCATSSECERGIEDGISSCYEWSLSVSISAELSLVKEFLSVGASTTVTVGSEQCKTLTTVSTCHWDDKGCHAVWTSNGVKVNHGYIRRRCNFGDGDKTVWSKDFDVREPAKEINIGCAASCSDTSYPA